MQPLREILSLFIRYFPGSFLIFLAPIFFISHGMTTFVGRSSVINFVNPKERRITAYAAASILGIFTQVSSITIAWLLPIFHGIGRSLGTSITYLFSGPLIYLIPLVYTFQLLGSKFGFARLAIGIFVSVLIGLSLEEISRSRLQPLRSPANVFGRVEENIYDLKVLVLLVSLIALTGGYFIPGPFQYKVIIVYGILLIAGILFTIKKYFEPIDLHEWKVQMVRVSPQWLATVLLLLILGVLKVIIPRAGLVRVVGYCWGSNTVGSALLAALVGMLMYTPPLSEVFMTSMLLNLGANQGPALSFLIAGAAAHPYGFFRVSRIVGRYKTFLYFLLVILFATFSGLIFGTYF